jgi:hypothetical protein
MDFGVPGPHFLHLLETVPLKVSDTPFKDLEETSSDIEVETLYFQFGDEDPFEDFMNIFNFKMTLVFAERFVCFDREVGHGEISR